MYWNLTRTEYTYAISFIEMGFEFTLVGFLVCFVFALKAAKKPSRNDQKVQAKVSILGFMGFLFGILSMAMFSPGEKGDIASIGVGFIGQMFGLLIMLGGVIVQFEAGNKEKNGKTCSESCLLLDMAKQ